MQLNQDTFSQAYDALIVAFNRERNDFIKGAYFKGAIQAKFDNRTWELACEAAIHQDKFFPTLDRLVELALGDRLQDQAQEDWRWAYYLISGGEAMHGLSDVGRMALESLGKPRDIGQQSDDYVKSTIRDKFFKAYRSYALRNGLGALKSSVAIEGDSRREGLRRLFDA